MKLQLKRIAKKEKYTIGKLYIDGQYFCDTIEDKDRGLQASTPLDQIKKIKVPGETAIPIGTYRIDMNVVSPKYSKSNFYMTECNGKVPRLVNVPGYNGVLIHAGNTEKDTEGCLIVGENKAVGQVINSRNTWKKLYTKLKAATDTITIEIS